MDTGLPRSKVIEKQLDPVFQEAIDSGRVPGVAAVALDKHGNTLFSKGYGSVTYGDDKAARVTAQTTCMVFSCTKLLASVAFLQLWEQGKISIDDDVDKYMPQISGVKVLDGFNDDGSPRLREPTKKIKVIHLLTHTSGLAYDFFDKENLKWRVATGQVPGAYGGQGSLEYYASPLAHDPGQRYTYGVNTDWLGFVIQAVTGMPIANFIDQNIIQPLGLKQTGLGINADGLDFLNLHLKDAEGNLQLSDLRLKADAEWVGAGHYVYSTCEDYAQFLLTVMNYGTHPRSGVKLLSSETVEKFIFTDQLSRAGVASNAGVGRFTSSNAQWTCEGEFLPGTPKGWSLALMTNSVDTPNGRKAGSGGWTGLGNSYYWMDPVSGKLGILSSSIFPFFDKDVLHLFDALERAVYDKPMAKEKGEPGSNFSGGDFATNV